MHWFRPPLWLRALSNLPLVAATVLFLVPGVSNGGGALVFGIVVSVVAVAFIVRSFMLCIGADDSGVTVVGWRGAQRYPWSDVLYFEFNRAGLWLVRRSRETVPVKAFAFGRALKSVRRQGEAVTAELEALRKAHKTPTQQRPKKKRK